MQKKKSRFEFGKRNERGRRIVKGVTSCLRRESDGPSKKNMSEADEGGENAESLHWEENGGNE